MRLLRICIALVLVLRCAAVAPALANPTGGTVVAGSASISSTPGTMTIQQNSSHAIINWQNFSIGAGELTQFLQPSSGSAVLNRVTSANPSQLYGQLKSNGLVYLLNPNGILIGPSGQIATGGFIASTLDLANGTFMAGGPLLFSGFSSAPVVNLGTISAASGDVALLAAQVSNAGTLEAPNGLVALGSGSQVLYAPGASGDITIDAPAATPPSGAAVSNTGSIAAAVAELKAAGSPYQLAVNNGGLINATAVESVGGRVILDGGGGEAADSGSITALAPSGGSVELSGAQLAFTGTVDTTGPNGIAGNLLLDPLVLDNSNIPGIVSTLNTTNVTESASDSITVNSAISNPTTTNRLTLDAPTIAVNASIALPDGSLTFDNFSGNPGGTLTSASGATITANAITLSNTVNPFTSMTFAGPVTVGTLTLSQGIGGGVGPVGSFTATNSANAISQLAFPGINAFSGAVDVATSTALTLSGSVQPEALTVAAGGNLTVGSGSVITAGGGTTILASTGGAFINDAGATLFAGTGRDLIYSSIDAAPFSDGGLGFTMYNPVAFPTDPIGSGNLEYIGLDSLLPPMTITAPSVSRTYGQPDPTFSATFTGGTSADIATPVQFTVGNDTNAGIYTIVPSGAVSSTNSLTFANGTLTVNPAPLTVTVPNATTTYGSIPNLNVGSVQLSGLVNGDTASDIGLSLTTSATNTSNVGPYQLDATVTSSNYAPTFVNGTMTVTPLPVTLSAPSTSTTYGSSPILSGTSVQVNGLPGGITSSSISGLQLSTTETSASPVGTYAIVPSLVNPDYFVAGTTNGTLTVTPAPLYFSVNNAVSMVGQIPVFSASFSGFLNGDTAADVGGMGFGTTAFPSSPAGTYPIFWTGQGGANNYTLVPTNPYGTLTLVSQPPPPATNTSTTTLLPTTTTTVSTTTSNVTNPNNNQLTSSNLSQTEGQGIVVMPDWLNSGTLAQQEENSIVNEYAAASGLSTATIVQDLENPSTQATMMGNLLPFVYQDLTNILNTPPSQWTPAQQGFVTAVENFVQSQQEQAADQAAAAYQQWAQQQSLNLETSTNGTGGITGVYLSAIASSNPPVPPDTFMNEATAGLVMSNTTATTFAGMEGQVASFGQEINNYQQYGQQALDQLELNYLVQQNPSQAAYYQQLYAETTSAPSAASPAAGPGASLPTGASPNQLLQQLYAQAGGPSITSNELSTQVATIAQNNGETLDYIPGTISDISHVISSVSTLSNIAVDSSQMVAEFPSLGNIFQSQQVRLALQERAAKVSQKMNSETTSETTETPNSGNAANSGNTENSTSETTETPNASPGANNGTTTETSSTSTETSGAQPGASNSATQSTNAASESSETTSTVNETTNAANETSKITNAATQTTETVSETTETAADVMETIAEGAETVGAAAGPVGLVLELVGNVVQVGVAAAQYSSIQTYDTAFNSAIQTAFQPVTTSTLQSLESTSGTSLFDYLGAMMAGSMQ